MALELRAFTVAKLASTRELGLTTADGGIGLERAAGVPIAVERKGPFPRLHGGEIVLTSGLHIGEDWTAWKDFLSEVTGAGAPGLGAWAPSERLPARVLALASEYDLPLLTGDIADFGRIAHTIAVLHAEGQREALRRPLDLQMEITAIVARGGSFGDLLSGWQQRTDEPVAVFDRLGRVMARSSAFPSVLLTPLSERLAGREAPRLGAELPLSATELVP